MSGLLLQPGRDEGGLRSPGSHRVTGWAAISFSSRAASSSRVSPTKTRLLAFRMRWKLTLPGDREQPHGKVSAYGT